MYKPNPAAVLAAMLPPILSVLLGACSDGSDRPGHAVITGVLAGQTMSGEPIPCTERADDTGVAPEAAGVRVCQGDMNNGSDGADLRFRTFDGVPLAVWVTLPPAPASSKARAVSISQFVPAARRMIVCGFIAQILASRRESCAASDSASYRRY